MTASRIFELRIYESTAGNLEALSSRFRDHTLAIFDQHGIEVVGFWQAPDATDPSTGKLVYVCAFPSRQAADEAWKAFIADPAWESARAETEKDGPLTASLESTFMVPTDYSRLT